jgi:hypothetical protein
MGHGLINSLIMMMQMIGYFMTPFLHKFSCFDCQICFKRPATVDASTGSAHQSDSELVHACPNCGHKMAFMGRNFSAPPKADNSGWFAAKSLWEAGFRFSGSGSHSDSPLPRSKVEVAEFIKLNPKHSQKIGRECKWSEYV